MPPAFELGIFLVRVSGIINHHISILGQGHDVLVYPVVIMLGISTDRNRFTLKLDSITTSPIRMVQLARTDNDIIL